MTHLAHLEEQIRSGAERQEPVVRVEVTPVLSRLSSDEPEAAAEALDILAAIERRAREAKAAIKEALVDWLERNGELEIGDMRYWAGEDRETSENDTTEAAVAILNQNGDPMDLIGCIRKGGLKPSVARQILVADFDRFFTTTTRTVLKDGKPRKRLQSVNTKFLK